MIDADLTARLDAIDEQLANINQGISALATQLNTMTIRASVVGFGHPNSSGGYNPDGMANILAAIKGTAAFSLIPEGSIQTTAAATIKKGSGWDYSIGRHVCIECAAWGINLDRIITEKTISADGRYVALTFNTPLPLPLAVNDKIYPLPW